MMLTHVVNLMLIFAIRTSTVNNMASFFVYDLFYGNHTVYILFVTVIVIWKECKTKKNGLDSN